MSTRRAVRSDEPVGQSTGRPTVLPRHGVIDDTAVGEAALEMKPEEFIRSIVDPDGVRIADEVTEAIRKHLAATGHPLKDTI